MSKLAVLMPDLRRADVTAPSPAQSSTAPKTCSSMERVHMHCNTWPGTHGTPASCMVADWPPPQCQSCGCSIAVKSQGSGPWEQFRTGLQMPWKPQCMHTYSGHETPGARARLRSAKRTSNSAAVRCAI